MASKPKTAPVAGGWMRELLDELAPKDQGGEYITFEKQDNPDPSYLEPRLFFRSGLTVIDTLMGFGRNGGLGSGRMTELYGKNRTGKSALATELAHQSLVDHADVHTMYVDMERALTTDRLAPYPLFKSNRFSVVCPSSLDKACALVMRALNRAADHKARMFIIWDSVASMRAESELRAEDGKIVMMAQAQLLSKELPKIRGVLSKTESHLLMLNQMRDKQHTGHGPPPDHTPGGNSIQYYADYRIKTAGIGKYSLAGGKTVKAGCAPSGFMSKVASIKNKSGVPDRSVMVPLIFYPSQGHRSGLSELWSLFHAFRDTNIMKQKSGGMYTFDNKEWFPRVGWADFLRKNTTGDGYTGPIPGAIETWREKLLCETYGDGGKSDGEGEEEEEDTEKDAFEREDDIKD